MALGCAFIFLVILMCWRRRARKQRAKQTAQFAAAKSLDKPQGWRYKLIRFGERLFGHRRSTRVTGTGVGLGADSASARDEFKLMQLKDLEEERHQREMEKILGGYEYSRAGSSRHGYGDTMTTPSIYSQVTGVQPNMPEPRLPITSLIRLPPNRTRTMTRTIAI
jgi:hypothetical protein